MVLGRETQRDYLEQFYNRSGSQLIVMYGAKGAGKTYLLKEFMKNRQCCYYQARSCSDKEQAYLWSRELNESGTEEKLKNPDYDAVAEYVIRKEDAADKLILVIDEFQHMVKNGRDFIQSMVKLLHHSWSKREVLIILCSSCIGWVENSMVTRMGEAAFEISGFLKLKELGFAELYRYFQDSFDVDECAGLYSVLGGNPGCWKWIDTSKSLKDNICELFLQQDGALERAAREQVESQLREANVYHTILAALAAGSQKLNDLYHDTGFSRAKISVYLKNLMELEIVEKIFSFDTEGRENTQKGVYRINNHLVRFYFRFLYPHLSALAILTPEEYYEKYVQSELPGYVAEFFGKICSQYLEQENQQGRLAADFVKSGEWVGKMGSLDFVAQDEAGYTIICGCSYEEPVMDYMKYAGYMECAKSAKLKPDEVYLFAREGFDEKICALANENERVHTIAWRNLYI